MAYVNALLVLFGIGLVMFGFANGDGVGLAVAVSGFVAGIALIVLIVLIVLTRRVADLEDRRDDREEHRNVEDRSA